MAFAGKVWRLLVGVKDALVLLFMLLFFAALHAALTARAPVAVERDGALLLRLAGTVVEEPAEADPLAFATGDGGVRQFRARDVIRAIRGAVGDRHVKAVVIDLSDFLGTGRVTATEMGAAMDAVRAAGKPVLVYGLMMEDGGIQLAAHASEVWLDPMGGAFVVGPGGQQLYYAGLLRRLNISAHVYRVGTYKDYVEPYLLDRQSDASRAAHQALYGAIWEQWRADVLKARPKAQIDRVARDPVAWLRSAGGDGAKAALAAGLVDKLGDRAEFGARVAELAGADRADRRPGAFAHITLGTWLRANPASSQGKAIGVVTVAGEIVDGKAGPGTAGGDRIARAIDAAADRKLAALVVRIDSPGGSVTGSESIRAAVARAHARGLPVAVSMGNVAASGGYWVATAGQRIFAEPATLTGSIGIFAVVPSFEKALAAWGVHGDGVRTTPLSGQPDPLAGLTPEVEAMLQANIEAGYARFLGLVGKSRGMPVAAVDAVAQGRVWDGGTARQKQLVDQFGGLDAALEWAAAQAHLGAGDWHVEDLTGEPRGLARLVESLRSPDEEGDGPGTGGASDFAGLVAQRQRIALDGALGRLRHLLGQSGAQAYCLACGAADGAPRVPPRATEAGWAGRLATLLSPVLPPAI
ncbi:MAG: signal peptide peptidase SppA [Proteobacteria bacterium]|nr:signal peptide peptidase SppA [Pseudomonadota bacterium]